MNRTNLQLMIGVTDIFIGRLSKSDHFFLWLCTLKLLFWRINLCAFNFGVSKKKKVSVILIVTFHAFFSVMDVRSFLRRFPIDGQNKLSNGIFRNIFIKFCKLCVRFQYTYQLGEKMIKKLIYFVWNHVQTVLCITAVSVFI